jgi:hypothetical protein
MEQWNSPYAGVLTITPLEVALRKVSYYMVTVRGRRSKTPTTFWISSGTEMWAFKRAQQLLGEPCDCLDIAVCGGHTPAERPGPLTVQASAPTV